ncbi:MAG: class II histone deacetylase [Thermoleophilia bacterium]|nr:class II histone deacetylase [Thermoleophilia bacterium]
MSTGFHWHELYAWHDTGTGSGFLSTGGLVEPEAHGESPATKRRLRNLLDVTGLLAQTVEIPGRKATAEELLRVHTGEYVERVKRESEEGGGDGGELAPFGPGGYEICALSAGGVIATIEAVWNGDVDNAYSLNRPPGHHAERDEGRGFCVFANIAVAVEHARKVLGVERLAIVDWDVHHGNGTEHAFYEDPDVLTISLHQDGLYPAESGLVEHTGTGAGAGATVNVPLPPGSGNGAYEAAIERVVVPAIEAFKPQIIIIASGLDASMMDPLAMMVVTSEGYRRMTDTMVDLAARVCDGKLVAIHEGGYSSSYVPFCGAAVIEGLLGIDKVVEDPYIEAFRGMGYMDLQPHQEAVIEAASSQLRGAPAS